MDWRAARISMSKGSVVRRSSNKSFVVFRTRAAFVRSEELEKSFLLNNFHKTFIRESGKRDVTFEGVYLKYETSSGVISQYEPSQTDKKAEDWEVITIIVENGKL